MKAYQLIEKPENWTIKVCARDKNGKNVSHEDSSAYCFCMLGALMRLYPSCDGSYGIVRDKVASVISNGDNEYDPAIIVGMFNDSHTH